MKLSYWQKPSWVASSYRSFELILFWFTYALVGACSQGIFSSDLLSLEVVCMTRKDFCRPQGLCRILLSRWPMRELSALLKDLAKPLMWLTGLGFFGPTLITQDKELLRIYFATLYWLQRAPKLCPHCWSLRLSYREDSYFRMTWQANLQNPLQVHPLYTGTPFEIDCFIHLDSNK